MKKEGLLRRRIKHHTSQKDRLLHQTHKAERTRARRGLRLLCATSTISFTTFQLIQHGLSRFTSSRRHLPPGRVAGQRHP